jgi:uncharacterized protein
MAVHQSFIEEVKLDRVILSRLLPDEDLFQGLEGIARDHGIERGVILSAIGSLKEVIFRNVNENAGLPVSLNKTHQIQKTGPMELLSLEGNLFLSEGEGKPVIHLHALLGSPSGNVIGGHLFKATVFTTVEIVMGKIVGSSVYKAKSELTGLMELLKK